MEEKTGSIPYHKVFYDTEEDGGIKAQDEKTKERLMWIKQQEVSTPITSNHIIGWQLQ